MESETIVECSDKSIYQLISNSTKSLMEIVPCYLAVCTHVGEIAEPLVADEQLVEWLSHLLKHNTAAIVCLISAVGRIFETCNLHSVNIHRHVCPDTISAEHVWDSDGLCITILVGSAHLQRAAIWRSYKLLAVDIYGIFQREHIVLHSCQFLKVVLPCHIGRHRGEFEICTLLSSLENHLVLSGRENREIIVTLHSRTLVACQWCRGVAEHVEEVVVCVE